MTFGTDLGSGPISYTSDQQLMSPKSLEHRQVMRQVTREVVSKMYHELNEAHVDLMNKVNEQFLNQMNLTI